MKKSFLQKFSFIFILFALTAFVFGQDSTAVVPVNVQSTAEVTKDIWFYLRTILLTGVLGQLAVLFADAYKNFGAGWSWAIFLETKIKPFLLVQGIALLIVLALFFFPQLTHLIDVTAGLSLDTLTVTVLFGTATAIADGLLKKRVQPTSSI